MQPWGKFEVFVLMHFNYLNVVHVSLILSLSHKSATLVASGWDIGEGGLRTIVIWLTLPNAWQHSRVHPVFLFCVWFAINCLFSTLYFDIMCFLPNKIIIIKEPLTDSVQRCRLFSLSNSCKETLQLSFTSINSVQNKWNHWVIDLAFCLLLKKLYFAMPLLDVCKNIYSHIFIDFSSFYSINLMPGWKSL